MIHIRNKHDGDPTERFALYVGRGSVLGNPFIIDRDGDRATVIQKYRHWLASQMCPPESNARVERMLRLIAERAREGDIALLCSCAPLPCHAEVIREAVCATFAGPDDRWIPEEGSHVENSTRLVG